MERDRIKEYESLMIKEAKKRGFGKGAIFTSATGRTGCKVGDAIKMKFYSDVKAEDRIYNGDLVSTNGVGCIFDRRTKKWATITKKSFK